MDFIFSAEQAKLQQSVREYCLSQVVPQSARIEKENRVPRDLVSGLAGLGLFGLPFERKYGGSAMGFTGAVLAVEELARADGAVAMLVGMNYLAGVPINLFGTEDQKQKYLTRLCSGSGIGSFAFTESATGSDPQAIVTEAVVRNGEYILNGVKRFVTAADLDGVIVLSVKDGKGNSAFIGEKNTSGYAIDKVWDKLGMHGISLIDVRLTDYHIPAANLLGTAGSGYAVLLDTIALGKLNTCAVMLGCAQAALDEAIKYAKERTSRGKPITQFQAIQSLIADMAVKVEAARWMTYRLASLADAGKDVKTDSAAAKLFVTEAAVEVAHLAFKVHGAYGYVSDYKIERILRDIYLGEVVEGSNEVQKVIIASSLIR
jgi:alkylation response protein AidB-like acyl-CoA dehydrogenase